MREIKFRAWVEFEPEVSADSRPVEMQYDVQNGDTLGNTFADALNSPRCTVMQYTGLKDKNGKEAYEGDIAVHPGQSTVCQIVFESQMGGYGFRDNENVWQGMLRTGLEFEVIGNIYENPELLQS